MDFENQNYIGLLLKQELVLVRRFYPAGCVQFPFCLDRLYRSFALFTVNKHYIIIGNFMGFDKCNRSTICYK